MVKINDEVNREQSSLSRLKSSSKESMAVVGNHISKMMEQLSQMLHKLKDQIGNMVSSREPENKSVRYQDIEGESDEFDDDDWTDQDLLAPGNNSTYSGLPGADDFSMDP